MAEVSCDVLIVGGGTGGVAAALAAADMGMKVILTEETDWVGGQLTSQAVPPDEHPWIEEFGCTRRYWQFRNAVRDNYRRELQLSPETSANPAFNPGGGWVSNLCFLPFFGHQALAGMLAATPGIEVRLKTVVAGGSFLSGPPVEIEAGVELDGDRVVSIQVLNTETLALDRIQAKFFLDATELGDLLPLTGTEYVTGAESRARTGERHAVEGQDQPGNQQSFTWVMAMGYAPNDDHVILRPESYERWRSFKPGFWPVPLLDLTDVDPVTMQPRHIPLFSEDWKCWFKYRQIFDPERTPGQPFPITIVNWPQNDYFITPIVDVTPEERWERLQDAKELTRCLLYWLQTECPHPEGGGAGYPGLFPVPISGMRDGGFAKTPYIRESRRIVAKTTVTEANVTPPHRLISDSVGIGSYRIDLHASTGGDSYIDLATIPFQIPLGSLIPIRMRNLLPACKNLGTTHLTNGCYRLHPVEWNIGEAAGALAAFCIKEGLEPAEVMEGRVSDFQRVLIEQGFELEWPESVFS
jgi:hypothetical protein